MMEVLRHLLPIVTFEKQEEGFKTKILGTPYYFSSAELIRNAVFDVKQMKQYLQSA